MKLWGGRFEKETDRKVEAFSSSLSLDQKLWRFDIQASVAHARMLGEQGIISRQDSQEIIKGLEKVGEELLKESAWESFESEDIHSLIEEKLLSLIGEPARKLHTARSRNDQVATDLRLYLLNAIHELSQSLNRLQRELLNQAEAHTETLLPGMTHLQHAQPISLAHHLLAYFWMLKRDFERLQNSVSRVSVLPLGAAALAGTGFPIDRQKTKAELGFAEVAPNSLDAVSDRDFVVEFISNCSLIMMHLSRFAEEMIIWSTPEFSFVEMSDAVTTGSSIMPQKKNPDVAELIRGKVGRVYGALMGSLTMMKALPLSYNRDLQEDKFHLFEAFETTQQCVEMTELMLQNSNWKIELMKKSLQVDFSNATDLADYLVTRSLSFREAHEVVGRIVQFCLKENRSLQSLQIQEFQTFHPAFEESLLGKITPQAVLKARTSEGGTSPDRVREQIDLAQRSLGT